jgi:hypothetical protein
LFIASLKTGIPQTSQKRASFSLIRTLIVDGVRPSLLLVTHFASLSLAVSLLSF